MGPGRRASNCHLQAISLYCKGCMRYGPNLCGIFLSLAVALGFYILVGLYLPRKEVLEIRSSKHFGVGVNVCDVFRIGFE